MGSINQPTRWTRENLCLDLRSDAKLQRFIRVLSVNTFTMIEFYNVKKKKKVSVDESSVTKQAYEKTTKTGKQSIRYALKAVDASYLQKRFYTQMSGGEKQRVQLARVLAQIWQPSDHGEQFLVLDEPTSAFDLSHQQLTLDIVRQLAERGVGVLMVVHDLNLAARCADNLVVFDGGVIAAQGKPKDILSEQLIDKVFGVKSIISQHPVTKRPLVIV